jgi:hypothetical protein
MEPLDENPPTGRRQRPRTPVEERSQRMHRFSGRLLAALDDATAGGVENVALGCLSAREAAETVLELREVVARLQGLHLTVLAHADAQKVSARVDGPTTVDTAAWLACAGLTAPGSARREVELATAVAGTCAATGSALLAGDIDAAQAEAIVWSLSRLPRWVKPEQREEAEKAMLAHALRFDAAQLRRLGRRLLRVIDPDGADEEEARLLQAEEDDAARSTSLSMWDDRRGTTHLFAKMPTRHGQMLRKVIEAIANPQLPDAISRTDPAPDHSGILGDDGVPPLPARPVPEVLGEAFCRLIETLDPDTLPTSGGMNASVVVTMTLETLRGGLAAATMDTGCDLSPGEARRMACSAGVIPMVLGGKSEILDYGRRRRLHTKPQRLAMAVRQSFRCAAEGCTRPSAWCDAHHLVPWSCDGETNLDDGALLCARHHTLAHHPDYHLERRPGFRVSISRRPRQSPRRQ